MEYQRSRIVRYYGYTLDSFDLDILVEAVEDCHPAYTPRIWEDSGMMFYEYPQKPLIIIKEGRFYTAREVWEGRRFTHSHIRHQASILLRMLHRMGLATYHRKAIPKYRFVPYKWRKRRQPLQQ